MHSSHKINTNHKLIKWNLRLKITLPQLTLLFKILTSIIWHLSLAFLFLPEFCKLNGIWIDHLECVDKKANIKAENTDGVSTPARLSNDEIWLFNNKMDGQIYFRLVYILHRPEAATPEKTAFYKADLDK